MKKISLLVIVLLLVTVAVFACPSGRTFVAARSHHEQIVGGKSHGASFAGLWRAAQRSKAVTEEMTAEQPKDGADDKGSTDGDPTMEAAK